MVALKVTLRTKMVLEKIRELAGKDRMKRLYDFREGVVPILERTCGLPREVIEQELATLSAEGNISRSMNGKMVTSISVKRETLVVPEELPKRPRGRPRKNPLPQPIVAAPIKEAVAPKRYVLLVDWCNLEALSPSPKDIMYRLARLEETLRERGTIEAKFCFVPDHRTAMVQPLSTEQRYFVVVCPRTGNGNGGAVVKDKDRVDARMSQLGSLVSLFGKEISHVVIVSGDGDYVDLATYAKDHRKKVVVASGAQGLSQALERAADDLIIL